MAVPTASQALERGRQFLLMRQGGDGLWRDFLTPAGEASQWPSAFIAKALQMAGAPADALERTATALLERQNTDGGWGYNDGVPTDADSTAWVLLFLTQLGCRSSACDRAASCLISCQRRASGGVATYSGPDAIRRFMGVGPWMPFWGWCSAHTEVTALVARALAALAGDRYTAEVDAAWRFVRSRQRNDGSWSSYWWTSPHYTTARAVELAGCVGDHAAVARAAAWIRNRGHGDRSGPDKAACAFKAALSLSILLSANVDAQSVELAIDELVALQRADGGWVSGPIMRIPLPADSDPNGERRWRVVRFERGAVVGDQYRTFTSAACVDALARVRTAGFG